MKEFRCSSLGNECTWKHIAKDDQLADMITLHLREIHGAQAVDSETMSTIQKLFTYPSIADAAAAADVIIKEYNCNMDPGCAWRYIAMTEDLITEGAAVHAREIHGIRTLRREMIARVRRSIHAWGGEKEQKKTA